MTTELDQTILQEIKNLHRLKDLMNQTIKKINNVPGLEISVEILERKSDDGSPQIIGLEVSVKQEIYP